ncbi:RNA polymerase II degradation factor 1-like [Salvia miltiorrhiza]|uniref:RNA polymerase II degradation factor 1-like n=1 Tax=Salvia miltiorrhiza TaxID=226208 RepID=UPI0025ABC9F9|nr:RNA polymerase II degradation factor 1-like [Salvia miltiorrhiza]
MSSSSLEHDVEDTATAKVVAEAEAFMEDTSEGIFRKNSCKGVIGNDRAEGSNSSSDGETRDKTEDFFSDSEPEVPEQTVEEEEASSAKSYSDSELPEQSEGEEELDSPASSDSEPSEKSTREDASSADTEHTTATAKHTKEEEASSANFCTKQNLNKEKKEMAKNTEYMGDFTRPNRPYGQSMNQGPQNIVGGWRSQPNGGWENQNFGGNQFRRPPQMGYQQQQYFPPPQGPSQPYRPQYQQQQSIPQQNAPSIPPQKSTLEETLQAFMEMSKQSIESQASTIKRLETTVGQLSGTLNQIQQQQQPGKFHGQPAQTHQALAVTVLRSGKMVDNKVEVPNLTSAEQPNSTLTSAEQPSSTVTRAELPSSVQPRPELPSLVLTRPTDGETADKQKEGEKEKEVKLHKATAPYRPPIPFPNRLRNEKQDRQFEEFYNMLAKVRQVSPWYSRRYPS